MHGDARHKLRSESDAAILPTVACEHCGLSKICFPAALRAHELQPFSRAVQRGRLLEARAHLCRAGDSLEAVYVVRSGALKTVKLSLDGSEAVTGFFLPGEIVGLEAIADGRHSQDVVALERSCYCLLPLNELDRLAMEVPGLRRELIRLMSRAVAEAQGRMMLRGRQDARAQLAAFLLDMMTRLERRGLAATRLRLSMRWRDVASYLGLTFETVSRSLAWLRAHGVLETQARRVTVIDIDHLSRVAHGEACR